VYKKRKQKKRKLRHKDWWDKLCTIKKRKTKKVYRKWKKGQVTREVFVEKRRELKNLYGKKRKEKREEERKILKSLKNETEIWDFINRRRRKKVRKEAKVAQEDWRKYFMNLLGGEEVIRMDKEGIPGSRPALIGRGEQEEQGARMESLAEDEISEAVIRMRLKKAAGVDGIPMEAWRFGGLAVKKGLTEVIQKVWKDAKIPEEWRTSIIVPLYKNGDPNVIPNYRGISLLCTAYKIYAEIIRRRLVEEVEEKKALPESQMGFRKGRSTMDNIYILNHVIQREKIKRKEEKKVYALFIDLKAAFDNVNRGKLWRI